MTLEAILFTLACIGIAETAYLIETRKKGENPVCVVGENCEKVLGSKYSKVILFHNDVWGLLFYIAVAVLTAFLVIEVKPLVWWELLRTSAFHILRVGLAITFLWIGVLIFQDPEAWAGYLQQWAAKLLLLDIKTAMIATAVFDIVVGFLLLTNYFTFWASALASLHLIVVMTVSGINPITVRDLWLAGWSFGNSSQHFSVWIY